MTNVYEMNSSLMEILYVQNAEKRVSPKHAASVTIYFNKSSNNAIKCHTIRLHYKKIENIPRPHYIIYFKKNEVLQKNGL